MDAENFSTNKIGVNLTGACGKTTTENSHWPKDPTIWVKHRVYQFYLTRAVDAENPSTGRID